MARENFVLWLKNGKEKKWERENKKCSPTRLLFVPAVLDV